MRTAVNDLSQRAPAFHSRAKRLLDGAVAAGLLVTLSPLLGSIAWLVKRRMGSPVIFSQTRPGVGGEPFRLYKFRTMTDARDSSGALLTDAQRLTPLGMWLRSTSLDELPELVNVLKGEMSLVGPRPLLMRYVDHMTRREKKRFWVRPGITGLAQINGRNQVDWDSRLDYDAVYVETWSMRQDVRILFQTVRAVLLRSGVVADPMSTMLDLDEERAR